MTIRLVDIRPRGSVRGTVVEAEGEGEEEIRIRAGMVGDPTRAVGAAVAVGWWSGRLL